MERRRIGLVLAVAMLALVGGCASVSVDLGEAGGDGQPTATLDVANGTSATVVEVVDGDTIDVRFSDGSTDTVRLLGVDTPEVHADNDPAEYEGVPDDDAGATCLETAGEDASSFAERWLAGAEVTLVTDPAADKRGSYGRLLAYVHVAGNTTATAGTATAGNRTDFNARLLETGHARVYDSTFSRSEAYYDAEATAQSEGVGVWQCRTPDTYESDSTDAEAGTLATSDAGLTLEAVHADAAGNDNENLNDEYVVFGTDADAPLPLGGWTVSDDAGHTYTIPAEFALQPGETVTLKTGSGADTDDTLFWGRNGAVWNNGGDTVVVERDGETVLRYTYG